jgi:hypothetical protein
VYVLRVEGAQYQKYKNYEHALHDYNDAFKKGQVRQIQAKTMPEQVPLALTPGNEGCGKNVIIITLVVLVFVLWNRLLRCCYCN